jgi:hypothetical protein
MDGVRVLPCPGDARVAHPDALNTRHAVVTVRGVQPIRAAMVARVADMLRPVV